MGDCVSCKPWILQPVTGEETIHKTYAEAFRYAEGNLKPNGIEFIIFREDDRPGCCG